jgi:hypothetical protein
MILTTMMIAPVVAFAKVEPQFENLRRAKIQCTAVQGNEVSNGVVQGQLNAPTNVVTFNQDGGAEYTDAQCFIADGVGINGEKHALGGCFPLDRAGVKEFSSARLVLKRDTLNEVFEINFTTGQGRYTKSFSGCDWGRKCFSKTSEVHYENCTIL